MKCLKRVLVLQLLLLFMIPVAFADITITLPEKDIYNFGEKVSPSVTIMEDQDRDGFFTMNIICRDYELTYYTIPLSLEAGFRTQLTIPDLSLSKSMIGDCNLESNFEISDGEKIDSAESGYFLVIDKINIIIDENLEAKPGDNIIISGEIIKESNEEIKQVQVTISFQDKEYEVDASTGKFEHTIQLDGDAATGIVPMRIVARDKYDNYGDILLTININAIPTRITNIFEKDILVPGDNLKVQINLYDHKSNVMNGNVNVKVFDSNDEFIAEKKTQSSKYFEFRIDDQQAPGNYFLLSTFEDVKRQDKFVIGVLRKITMQQEGSFVYIENVGNVKYDDEITIVLENDEKNYLINEKINLVPGEKISIDLSKEVPRGNYDIILPGDVVESEDSAEGAGAVNVIQDVVIDDNRNVLKKTADGIASVTGAVVSSITGAVVSAAGYVASRPILAAIFLILIILGTIMRYSWGFIKDKMNIKKKDDTDNLFEDFKFDENEDSKPGN